MPFDSPAATLIFGEERFTALRAEGRDLFAAHWQEVNRDPQIPLDQDWDRYAAMEMADILTTVTAREGGGRLVGYSSYAIFPMLHSRRRVIADQVHYYLASSYRRGWNGMRLLSAGEALCAKREAVEIFAHVPASTALDLLFLRRGYRRDESIYRKRLEP